MESISEGMRVWSKHTPLECGVHKVRSLNRTLALPYIKGVEFYTLTKTRTLAKANKRGEREWCNEKPYKMGDGRSMLGATKTAHCIFLLERGGQLGPHRGATHEQYRKDMSLFLFSTVHSSCLSPHPLESAKKQKYKAVAGKEQAEREKSVAD